MKVEKIYFPITNVTFISPKKWKKKDKRLKTIVNTLQRQFLWLQRFLHPTFKHDLIVSDFFWSPSLKSSQILMTLERQRLGMNSLAAQTQIENSHLDLSISADAAEWENRLDFPVNSCCFPPHLPATETAIYVRVSAAWPEWDVEDGITWNNNSGRIKSTLSNSRWMISWNRSFLRGGERKKCIFGLYAGL